MGEPTILVKVVSITADRTNLRWHAELIGHGVTWEGSLEWSGCIDLFGRFHFCEPYEMIELARALHEVGRVMLTNYEGDAFDRSPQITSEPL